MKSQSKVVLVLLLVQLQFISCQKDDSDSNVPDKPEVTLKANAGPDQSIILPQNNVYLDASQSNVIQWKTTIHWNKISGPASFHISDVTAARTEVSNLVKGEYQFELNLMAEGGVSKDTVQVTVVDNTGTPVGKPVDSEHWNLLGYLPSEEFFLGSASGTAFNGSNFLMGVNNQVFAVSKNRGVWQVSGPNNWKKIGSFPEAMESVPLVFSTNDKAYCMGNGHLWQYDAGENLWQRKNDVPDFIRYAQVALVIDNSVYLVDDETSHVMSYDPATDTYTPQNNFPGTAAATGFVVSGKGYCIEADGKCWEYEPTTDTWQPKASLPSTIISMQGFSLGNYGYVLGDLDHAAYNQNSPIKVWHYDPTANEWREFEEDYPGSGAYDINAVSIEGRVIIGLGYNNGDWNATDLWQFD